MGEMTGLETGNCSRCGRMLKFDEEKRRGKCLKCAYSPKKKNTVQPEISLLTRVTQHSPSSDENIVAK